MRRRWARILEFGGLAVLVFLLGFAAGAGVLYLLHSQHWLGDKQVRQVAAFSEVPEGQAADLAARFRPWLRFDSDERWRPLNIVGLLSETKDGAAVHRFCTRLATASTCTPIASATDFRSQADRATALGGDTYVDIAGRSLEKYRGPVPCGGKLLDCGNGARSAIYYHVTQSNDRFYIDYWWFLRFNHFERVPGQVCLTETGRRSGACDEHEGDWEGVTVVTPPGVDDRIDYVVYAAHKGTFRYAATELGRHGLTRPDVYVARGSHASYPIACTGKCDQPIALQGLVTLPEASFDGKVAWERNGDSCHAGAADSCLLPLPRTDRDPQAWTVWPGQWGAGCADPCGGKPLLNSPRSPGLQARFQTPWCSTSGGAFSCDGRALGCSDWLGPLVAAVACDPAALSAGLNHAEEKHVGNIVLTVKGEPRTKETTPGVVQAVEAPLSPGETVTASGGGPGLQILVRARQGRFLTEARFADLGLAPGQQAVVTVAEGAEGPIVTMNGRPPVERRVLEVKPTPSTQP
jgi:hypothetical protein